MNISVIVPLLNEEESLPELTAWIDRVMSANNYSYEIIFIDDGSTDSSWSIIQGLKKKYSSVKALKFRRNYGKSAALNRGFAIAQGDVVITMDADLQDSPEEIPELYNLIAKKGHDLISGWKKKRYDSVLAKNIPSKLFNWAARKISGLGLHDFNCGLKAYKNEVVKNVNVYGEMHRYIPVLAKNAGYTNIDEKVVIHQARKYGTSKFGMNRFVNGFLDLMTIWFIGKFGKRPMHFFGALGSLFMFVGTGILVYLTVLKIWMGLAGIADRPLFFLGFLLMIMGLQLFITGFLAELISSNNKGRDDYHIEDRID